MPYEQKYIFPGFNLYGEKAHAGISCHFWLCINLIRLFFRNLIQQSVIEKSAYLHTSVQLLRQALVAVRDGCGLVMLYGSKRDNYTGTL